MSPPLVYVVVLNWNGLQDTAECLESCRRVRYPNLRVVVADNGSADGSEAALRARFPEIEVIQNGANLGFSGGNNAGIRHALVRGADFVVLLNNDTTVDPEFVSALVKAADEIPSAGILTSKIYFAGEPDVLWYAGATFHPWLGWGRHLGHGAKDDGRFDHTADTERPTGCAMMVSREVCERVGLLDEAYFCYCEDLDWGMRARAAGYRLLFVPRSRVWHKVSRSTGGASSGKSLYYFVRNVLRCLDRNHPLPAPMRQLRVLAVLATASLSLLTMGIPLRRGAVSIRRGLRDYLAGRFGAETA